MLMPTTPNLPPNAGAAAGRARALRLREPARAAQYPSGQPARALRPDPPHRHPQLRPDGDGGPEGRGAAPPARRGARARPGIVRRKMLDPEALAGYSPPLNGAALRPRRRGSTMQFPARFSDLPEYAFPRLRRLLEGTAPGGPDLAMTIGEPKHPLPALVAATVAAHAHEFALYPPNDGTPELRQAIAAWLARRYGVAVDPETRLVPLNGTREGLFNAAIALSPETKAGARPAILMPNPFYQAYGAAALAVGAEPVPVPATAATGFLPDYAALPPALLDRVTLCYLCSPANPQGAVADAGYWRGLIALAERHDFRILADECYAEIYRDTPPPGALEVGGSRRRRPRAGGDLQLALQALQRPRPALRLRRRRPALDRRPAPAPRLRRRAAAAPRPARLGGALAGRGPRPRQPRPLRREVRPRRPHARQHARLPPARRAASSSGSTSATARPSRSASGARPASASSPAPTSAAPPPAARTPASDTSASPWWPTPPRSSAASPRSAPPSPRLRSRFAKMRTILRMR